MFSFLQVQKAPNLTLQTVQISQAQLQQLAQLHQQQQAQQARLQVKISHKIKTLASILNNRQKSYKHVFQTV
jgi:nitrate reductase assembly molybdenum cofactor insertion protein NarJ